MVNNSPNPCPSRANYGFALYLASYSALWLYFIWMLSPEWLLEFVGLTFLPQKYWSVAVPLHASVTLAFSALLFYPALNLTLVPKTNDLSVITNKYAVYEKVQSDPNGVPAIRDLPITDVCESLYLKQNRRYDY